MSTALPDAATAYAFSPSRFFNILGLSASLLLSACGGGGGSSGNSAAPSCTDASYVYATVDAGDMAELDSQKQLDAVYLLQDGQRIELDYSGSRFAVPATQELVLNGGQISVEVRLDGRRCALPDLTVAALPAADNNSYADLLDILEESIGNIETMLAYDAATTRLEDAAADPLLGMAYWLHAIFFDAQSEISLPYQRQLLTQLTDDEKQYLARFIAKLDLINTLQDFADQFNQQPFEVVTTPPAAARSPLPSAKVLHVARAACSNAYNNSDDYKVTVRDAASLSVAMKLSYAAQQKLDNAQAGAAAAAAKSTAINTISTVAGKVKGGVLNGPLAALGAVTGVVAMRDSVGDQMLANLLPSKITVTRLSVIPKAQLEEDYSGKYAKPAWTLLVDASSNSYDFSKVVADFGLLLLGAPNSPVDGDLVAGFTEVSNKVTENLKAKDCNLIIPAIVWNDIPVDKDWAEASILSGDSFSVDSGDARILQPLKIGQSELEVKLKSDSFPSHSNTLAEQRALVTLENLKKHFVFSSSPIVVPSPGQVISVSVLLQNTVSPEQHLVEHSVGVLVSESLSGNVLNLDIDTPSQTDAYPHTVTVKSTSMSLDPVGDRKVLAEIVLQGPEIEIEESVAGRCDNGVYTEENRAVVIGMSGDTSVSWSSSGGTLTNLPNNEVRFEVSTPGSYTLTATSQADSNVSHSVTVNAADCSSNTFMWAQVVTNVDEPGTDTCGPENPEDVEAVSRYGVEVDDYNALTPANIRSKMSVFSDNQQFAFNQSDSAILVHSVDNNGSCFTQSLDLIANSQGTVTNNGNNKITLATSHNTRGECYQTYDGDGSSVVECTTAAALANYQMLWMFDHDQAASYDVDVSLSCTSGSPAAQSSLIYYLLLFNEQGQSITDEYSGIPVFMTTCNASSTPASHSWDVPVLPTGSTVMVMVMLTDTVTELPSLNGTSLQTGVLSATGSVDGFIQVKQR